jgi:hypothetical protein
MAGLELLLRQKAIALSEASETIKDLLGDEAPSERLMSAQHDVAGRTMPDYVFAMVVSELTRVVAAQQERIDELEGEIASQDKRLEELFVKEGSLEEE